MSATNNPWLSIWVRPRATIRAIVDTNPQRLNLPIIVLAGIGMGLDQLSGAGLGETLSIPVIFLLAVVLGPLFAWVGWYVYAALVKWTGKWIGGAGNIVHIRSAMAWSYVPYVLLTLLWLPKLVLFGGELFTAATPNISSSLGLAYGLMAFAVVQVVIVVWYFVIFLKTLGEVQGFSAWKALGNSLLPLLVIGGPIVILAVVVPMLV